MSKQDKKGHRARSEFIPEGSELERIVDTALDTYKDHHSFGLARQAVAAILKMLEENVSSAEWKLSTFALKEMRHAYRVFAPYHGIRKVTVFGSSRSQPDSPEFQEAIRFAEKISSLGYMVLTGAGPGVMHAANLGAGAKKSFGLNIDIPWEQKANPVIDGDEKLINFKYFFTRKLMFIKESDALVLFPGGYGTLDEAFETLVLIHAGKSPIKPIVMVDQPQNNYWTKWLRFVQSSQLKNGYISKEDLYLWTITYDIQEAVRIITDFYRNFHSQRWVEDKMVFRINRELTGAELDELESEFRDIIPVGNLAQREAMPDEAEWNGEIPFPKLPRLVFSFDKISFGRLRQMIDRINQFR